MRVTICAVGRMKAGPERDLLERYRRRIRWPVDIREVEERRKLPALQRAGREGALLEAACPDGAYRVALDASGTAHDSVAFARVLERCRDAGRGISFLVGGADGLVRPQLDRADTLLAFGTATWPHMLVRVMLVEQIFRAQEILAGNPYHRDGCAA